MAKFYGIPELGDNELIRTLEWVILFSKAIPNNERCVERIKLHERDSKDDQSAVSYNNNNETIYIKSSPFPLTAFKAPLPVLNKSTFLTNKSIVLVK